MQRLFKFFVFLFAFGFRISDFGFSSAHALPRKGFYEGPFITLSAGLMQFDWDVNQRTQVEEGSRYQTMLHLGFGWNILDWAAPELRLRFGTDGNNGRREYITGANAGCVFTALIPPFLNLRKWKILPFLKPGMVVQLALLPGDPLSGDDRMVNLGIGPSIGGGFRFLFGEYLYLGLEAYQDFISHETQSQIINGTDTTVYLGGWKRQFEALGMVGVHF